MIRTTIKRYHTDIVPEVVKVMTGIKLIESVLGV